ncbi:MAG: molecular chaperone TorD family protein [Planctomycetota bacterium]
MSTADASRLAGDADQLGAYARVCRALARLFLRELDRETLASARAFLIELLGEDAQASASRDLDALAADYAQTFLLGMPPYGSHYLDPSGLLNADSTGEVARLYREHGFVVDITQAPAEDHLGVELEFLAHLFDAEAAACAGGDPTAARTLRAERLAFLERQLLPFAMLFLPAAEATAGTTFYRALCRTAREVLVDLAT